MRTIGPGGTETDWSIMMQELSPHFPRVREASDGRTRPVWDGVQAVNSLLEPSLPPVRMLIDPRCTYLIRDLEQVAWKTGVDSNRELDKSDGTLTHHADCVRYPVAQHFPVLAGSVIGGMN